ncbi:MAG: hypothetical protein GXP32_04060 [Kiritimatiellaeota bacterium]|nr:hypothetical protein [Kiritimatiellota bacterium]
MILDRLITYAGIGVEPLNSDARERLKRFLSALERNDGGFAGTIAAEESDAYYTPFAVMALNALGVEANAARLAEFADSHTNFDAFDLAHLASLARLDALIAIAVGEVVDAEKSPVDRSSRRQQLASAILAYRSNDGGFSHFAKLAENSTPYGVFMAMNALAELECGGKVFDSAILANCVEQCRLNGGSFSNAPEDSSGGLNATAAAAAVLAEFAAAGSSDFDSTVDYIRSMRFSAGGFKAGALAPLPDILSTATAILALNLLDANMDESERISHRNFIGDHWRDVSDTAGGFAGDIISETPDAEYTFHALMTLGLLSNPVLDN